MFPHKTNENICTTRNIEKSQKQFFVHICQKKKQKKPKKQKQHSLGYYLKYLANISPPKSAAKGLRRGKNIYVYLYKYICTYFLFYYDLNIAN